MRKTYYFIVVSIIFCLFLFKNGYAKNTQNTDGDLVYSENIQNSFFGVKFGASKQEVVNAFNKQGLYTKDNASIVDNPTFYTITTPFVVFGKKDWDFVIPVFSNNKFYQINFMRFFNNTENAIKHIASVLGDLSSIYNMNEAPLRSNIYANYVAITNDRKGVGVFLAEQKDANGEIWFYVSLLYYDRNFTVSDDF